MPPFSLSACAPARDEAGNVDLLVRELAEVLAAGGVDYEIIIVDDGSADETPALLAALARETPALRVITHERSRGYGASLRECFAAAVKDYVFFTDGDRQYDVREMAAFLPLLTGENAAVGYRLARAEGAPRLFFSRGYNALVRLLFGVRVRDIDCSFKFLPRRPLQALDLRSDDFFIDAEVMLKLAAAGVPVVERGVRHLPRAYGRSTVSPGHIFTTLAEIFALSRELKKKKQAPLGPADELS